MEQPSSEYLTLTDASKAYFDTGTFAEKFLLTKNYADSATNIENLTAGASANDINVGGYAFIDAGAGDDVVNQQNFDERGFVDTDNPERSPELGAGQFIYGGDGNDNLWGTGGSDQLIGGQGHDFLNGGAGADTYYILPTAQGSDVIYDSGYPFSYDGWEEIYKNWFYGKEGYPNWHDLQYSGMLPDLPDFPINDYEALDAIVRAGVLARDTIEFAPGIALGDLSFAWGQADVTLIDGSTTPMRSLDISWGVGQTIQVAMPLEYDRAGTGIELFKFADGATLTMAEALRHAPPMPPNEIIGSADDDYLSGSSKRDHIVGLGGNDNLYGASGNDLMEGGTGDDIYVWSPGNGQDIITETDVTVGNRDTLQLYGLNPSDVTVTRDSNNIYIEINGTDGADKLTLKDFFVVGGEIEQVQFDDGTVWDAATLIGHIQEVTTNHAPTVVSPIAGQSSAEKQSWVFGVPADTFADIDAGDQLTYQATLENGDPLPTWLSFDQASMTFTGIPGNDNVGQLSLKLTATDQAGASATTNFNLSITNVNDAPVVNVLLADQAVVEYKAFTYVVPANTFADIDTGDTAVITANLDDGSALPDWLSFDPDTLTFSGTPTDMDLGVLSVKVTLTDQGGLSASDVIALAVNAAPGQKISGTTGNDTLTGLSGNDTLNGGAGADTMSGGTGNDKYVVDNVGDVVIEKLNEGTDTVQSSISYTLGANVEMLQLTGTAAINVTGNELNNTLTGNAAANTLAGGDGNDNLNGGAGADTMLGGIGNDNYTVDNVADVVTELAIEGTDRVKSYITYSLGNNLENLTLLGTGNIDGTGNVLGNSLTGNSAANRLAGGDGNDILSGSGGNDTLLGEAGDDSLTGGTGADTLIGGAGNDVYVVTDDQDTVTELANEGTDRVNASISYTLGDNVENLTLTGTAEIYGVGNGLDNVLNGNSAKNYLNGAVGNDTIRGNGANDLLQGGIGNDIVSDNGGNNLLDGGTGTDMLTGNAGNELFIGGQGNDTITTGTGTDMIVFNKGDGQDTVKANVGADNTLSLGGGINYTDLTLSKTPLCQTSCRL